MNTPVQRPVRRAAGAQPAQGRPARTQSAASAAAGNDPLYSEALLTSPSVRILSGTVKLVGEKIVQMFVKQRGGQLRSQDLPADAVLAIVYGTEPNSDQVYLESRTGPSLPKLVLTGYEGDYTVFQNQKGEKVLVRSTKANVQSDKRQPDVFGISTGSRASGGTGAPRGRRPAG